MSTPQPVDCINCIGKAKYHCTKCKRKSYCSKECQLKDHPTHKADCVEWGEDNDKTRGSLYSAYQTVKDDEEYKPLLTKLFSKHDVLVIHHTGKVLTFEQADSLVKYAITMIYKQKIDRAIAVPKDAVTVLKESKVYLLSKKEYSDGIGVAIDHQKFASIGSRISSFSSSHDISVLHVPWDD